MVFDLLDLPVPDRLLLRESFWEPGTLGIGNRSPDSEVEAEPFEFLVVASLAALTAVAAVAAPEAMTDENAFEKF